jgi:hypothetical protein
VTVNRRVTLTSSVVCGSVPSPIPAQRRSCFVGCSVHVPSSVLGVWNLESMSEHELERLYAGLVRLASMDETELAALVEQVLPGEELGST